VGSFPRKRRRGGVYPTATDSCNSLDRIDRPVRYGRQSWPTPQLTWRALDERTVEVATSVQNEQIVLRLVFNEAGEIAQTIAERPRLEGGDATTTRIGEYADYQQFGRVRCPPAPRSVGSPGRVRSSGGAGRSPGWIPILSLNRQERRSRMSGPCLGIVDHA
jgi:hypothetical protein